MSKKTTGIAIYWRLMFRVSNRNKADKQFKRAEALLGQKFRTLCCEPYWKISGVWICEATAHISAKSVETQVTKSLLLANRLATGWYVLGPHVTENGVLETLEGIFSRRDRSSQAKLQSLEWAHFQLAAKITNQALPVEA